MDIPKDAPTYIKSIDVPRLDKCACEIHIKVDAERSEQGFKSLKCYCDAKGCPHAPKSKFTYHPPGSPLPK